MMQNHKVAIVIPMYNCMDTIVPVLDSIGRQTCLEQIYRVILVNDGSTDKTLDVVYSYRNQSSLPIFIIDKVNGGVASARNEGLKNIGAADFVAFCDSDDTWLPNKLNRQLQVLEEHPAIDVLGCAFNNKPLKIFTNSIKELHKGDVKEMCIRNYPQPSTVIMKSRLYYEIGGFDEAQRYAEDGNYFLKIAAQYNLYYLPELLIEYGFGKRGFGGSGLSGNLKGMYEGNVKNLKELRELKYISSLFYYQMRIFHFAKYIRRIILATFTKNRDFSIKLYK